MTLNKSKFYSSFWHSCDELCLGMDAVLMGMGAKLQALEQRQNKIRSLNQGKREKLLTGKTRFI